MKSGAGSNNKWGHLPRNIHWHRKTMECKISRIKERFDLKASAYREGDLAFIAIAKEEKVRHEIDQAFSGYHAGSAHLHKSLHFHFAD